MSDDVRQQDRGRWSKKSIPNIDDRSNQNEPQMERRKKQADLTAERTVNTKENSSQRSVHSSNKSNSREASPAEDMTIEPTSVTQQAMTSQIIVVGDTGGSLSDHFIKRHKSKIVDNVSPTSITPPPAQMKARDARQDYRSKQDKDALRKKMMTYGKKVKPIKSDIKVDNEYSKLIDKVDAAKKMLSEAKARELERMARGIKPKIDRSEIREITKRNMKRFAQPTVHESRIEHQKSMVEDSLSMQAKRDDIKLRKMKALEMDKVDGT